jgi:hypothetical protein
LEKSAAALRNGRKKVSFPLEGGDLSRPDEVSEPARTVHAFAGEVCGTEGGVWVVLPEVGF